ncbi:MAG TPA: DUF72 domain-containing protein [Actinomycetota bacterium]|nr:DUF72 domain-containing protein [Actinomycetota bacterium]
MPQTKSGNVYIGTASWTDKTLIESGRFYPKEANTAEARLRYYAENFPIVEVDSTYYYPPSEKAVDAWVNRTPDEFTFHIKAYSLLTKHPTRPNSLAPDLRESATERKGKFLYASHLPDEVMDEVWRRFAASLMPLHSTGKLGVIHFQYPEWFMPGTESRNYIVECQERLHNYRIAVEFRNHLWFEERNLERTLEFLRSHDIPVTSVDMPQGFRSSLPPIAAATAKDLAYVRFHGRNTEQWDKPQEIATPRFAYKYTQEELAPWVPKLKELAGQVKEVHVLMNNCFQDYAVQNARDLGELLED